MTARRAEADTPGFRAVLFQASRGKIMPRLRLNGAILAKMLKFL